MNIRAHSPWLTRLKLPCLALILGATPLAHAGLTLDLQLQRFFFIGNYYYGAWPSLSTNGSPDLTSGSYVISSANYPSSGFSITYQLDATGFNLITGSGSLYLDFDPYLHDLTNGTWTIAVSTNGITTNIYSFKVTANLSSNDIPQVLVTYPADGASFVSSQPNFTWQGPASWSGSLVVQDNSIDTNGYGTGIDSAYLPTTQTNWSSSIPLPDGTNQFFVQYQTNLTDTVIASTPLDTLSHPISSWSSTADLNDYYYSTFVVGQAVQDTGLLAHYTFDDTNNPGLDSSGHGYDMDFGGGWNGGGNSPTNDAEAGAGAMFFFRDMFNSDSGGFIGWNTTPTNLLSALAGNFSVSLWVKTTDDYDYQGDFAYNGAGVVSADIPGVANDLVPVALTGGEVAFNTGNVDGDYDDTLSSSATVNDGAWHHVVVTRNQTTGEKDIYIDGALDNSDTDTTNLLSDPVMLTIGAVADASQTNPNFGGYYNGYSGLLDDLQIYSRTINSAEVAYLFNNPGAALAARLSNTYPVDVSFQLSIIHSLDPSFGDVFFAYPSFNSVNPDPTTTNSVSSPNGALNSSMSPGGSSSGSTVYGSLAPLIDECTNGLWHLTINQGSPTQQVYSFSVSIAGLDSNALATVRVFLPTNGAVNIATNPAFYWVGPSNYSTLVVDLLSGPYASLPVGATNWTSAPTLNYGPDRFDVNYTSNGFPGVTFSTPVDAQLNPVRTWTTTVTLTSESFNNFIVGAPAPLPVQLGGVRRSGGNLQFSFQTLAGRPHTIQGRTNLSLGAWLDLTNFVGDGSLRQFTFQATNPPIQFFRVKTQ